MLDCRSLTPATQLLEQLSPGWKSLVVQPLSCLLYCNMQLSETPAEMMGWKLKSDTAVVEDANRITLDSGGLRCLS
jgi:hypothetical protein